MKARQRERGSALLIVFVFAAVIAIMLYREMPVAVFEAHRQKEELLIDRGEEYKHAIKLYVRKLGTFPPSIEALENSACRSRGNDHRFQSENGQQAGCERKARARKCEFKSDGGRLRRFRR
jgi:hypothetical protein